MQKLYDDVKLSDIISCVTPMSGFSFTGNERILWVGDEPNEYCSCKGGTPLTTTTDNFVSVMAWVGNPTGHEWVSGGPYSTTAIKSITCEIPYENEIVKNANKLTDYGIEGANSSIFVWIVSALTIGIILILAVSDGILDLIRTKGN